jgi:hypothetical protein
VTFRLKPDPPAVATKGNRADIAGVGLALAKVIMAAFELLRLGLGFNATTLALPGYAISGALTCAVS